MQYKTIVLGLLEQHPQWLEQLRRERAMLPTLEKFGQQLEDRHEFWQAACLETNPNCDLIQLSSMALELAIEELDAQWGPELPPQEAEFLSLDAAMNYLRQVSSPA